MAAPQETRLNPASDGATFAMRTVCPATVANDRLSLRVNVRIADVARLIPTHDAPDSPDLLKHARLIRSGELGQRPHAHAHGHARVDVNPRLALREREPALPVLLHRSLHLPGQLRVPVVHDPAGQDL